MEKNRRIQVKAGITVGLPGYSNAKFEVGYEADLDDKDDLDKAVARAFKDCRAKVNAQVETLDIPEGKE